MPRLTPYTHPLAHQRLRSHLISIVVMGVPTAPPTGYAFVGCAALLAKHVARPCRHGRAVQEEEALNWVRVCQRHPIAPSPAEENGWISLLLFTKNVFEALSWSWGR